MKGFTVYDRSCASEHGGRCDCPSWIGRCDLQSRVDYHVGADGELTPISVRAIEETAKKARRDEWRRKAGL